VGALDDEVAALARGANFASLTTLLPDGSPVSSLMWIDADDDHLLINTERHRLKYRNVSADPRVQVLIIDQDDLGHYAAVRGIVSEQVTGQAARDHIDRLAQKYLGQPFDSERVISERIILKISPLRQRVRHSSVVVE
jgi:PPOX class probable F420-dependent enzyme